MSTQLLVVVTTVDTAETARRMARALVEQGLAACAQISQIESFYNWQGAMQHEPEFRILFKTTAARWEAVESAIRSMHPYGLPAIHAMPVQHAHAAYADWVAAQADA